MLPWNQRYKDLRNTCILWSSYSFLLYWWNLLSVLVFCCRMEPSRSRVLQFSMVNSSWGFILLIWSHCSRQGACQERQGVNTCRTRARQSVLRTWKELWSKIWMCLEFRSNLSCECFIFQCVKILWYLFWEYISIFLVIKSQNQEQGRHMHNSLSWIPLGNHCSNQNPNPNFLLQSAVSIT